MENNNLFLDVGDMFNDMLDSVNDLCGQMHMDKAMCLGVVLPSPYDERIIHIVKDRVLPLREEIFATSCVTRRGFSENIMGVEVVRVRRYAQVSMLVLRDKDSIVFRAMCSSVMKWLEFCQKGKWK